MEVIARIPWKCRGENVFRKSIEVSLEEALAGRSVQCKVTRQEMQGGERSARTHER